MLKAVCSNHEFLKRFVLRFHVVIVPTSYLLYCIWEATAVAADHAVFVKKTSSVFLDVLFSTTLTVSRMGWLQWPEAI